MHYKVFDTGEQSTATRKASVMPSLDGKEYIVNYYERNGNGHMSHKARFVRKTNLTARYLARKLCRV